MLYSSTLNNKINRISGNALGTEYSNSYFNELLDEFCKYFHGLCPTIIGEVFQANETIPFDLRIKRT